LVVGLPAELLADGLGKGAELLAFAEVDDDAVVPLDLDRGVGGVDGAGERPGWLVGEADLGGGVAAFQLPRSVRRR
jgi:hypothetical protein